MWISKGNGARAYLVLLFALFSVLLFSKQGECLNTFMVKVPPVGVECHYVTLKVGDETKISMIVEHDDENLTFGTIIDLTFRGPDNADLKMLTDIEHTEFTYKAVSEGKHIYCFVNKAKIYAAVSFTIWEPEDYEINSKRVHDVIPSEDGKDIKDPLISDIARLDELIAYLALKAKFMGRKSAELHKCKKIR